MQKFAKHSIIFLTFFIASNVYAKFEKSDYRPDTKVEFIYDQQIDSVYSTNWLAKLENKQGTKRTAYIETVGKFVNKGFVTFDCANPKADVNFALYGWNKFGDNTQLEKIIVHSKDFKAWKNNTFEPLAGEDPPYNFYLKLRSKYCKF